MASLSSWTRASPQPLSVQCIRAPPSSSSDTFSPTTTSTIRGEPRYIDALPSTMTTTSQKAGMYAPPAADGPNSRQTWHEAGKLDLVEEDASRVSPAGEHLDLIGYPRPGGVDQIEQGHADARGRLLDADD